MSAARDAGNDDTAIVLIMPCHARHSSMRCMLCASLAAAVALNGGCAASLKTALVPDSLPREHSVESHIALIDSQVPDPKEIARRKSQGEPAPTQEQAFAEILGQLEEIDAIDPEAQQRLLADLKDTKPEDYALVVDAYRSALAFRQQHANSQQRRLAASAPASPQEPPTARPVAHQPSNEPDDATGRHANPSDSYQSTGASQPPAQLSTATAIESDGAVNRVSYEADASAMRPAAPATAKRSQPPGQPLRPIENTDEPAENAAAVASDQPIAAALTAAAVVGRTTPPPSTTVGGDWRKQLDSAIADLQRSVVAKPTTVAELHDHMRLRTLELLAGNEEDAYRPIPGASPAQQDYWSKQLFAMSAYLNASQLDDKQRAVAALGSLDEARAKLSELATLQIRNLSFVDSVDGFGAYVPRKTTSFNPGQKATVYAEVDNFTSNSKEDGYHTSLGTSYQVLDKTGRRIEGKQFPDVEDACRNRRRDFHMQYQFALPTKIYPGPYDLEITITDHNSGKIAQSTVAFEIAGEQ